MSDYIKREDAVKAFENICVPRKATNGIVVLDIDEALSEIELVPSADVVEVVRCKDCRKWITVLDREKASYGLCEGQPQGLATRSKNDFCSYGEKEEYD